VDDWYDFGHLPLLYRSKRELLVSRAFNTITCDGITVTKSSQQKNKIESEINWYMSIPENMRIYTPQFLGRVQSKDIVGCKLEYMYLPTLSELYIYGALPAYQWRSILKQSLEFMRYCNNIKPPSSHDSSREDYPSRFFNSLVQKSHKRLIDFIKQRGWSINQTIELNGVSTPPLITVLDDLISLIPPTKSEDICLWHGDLFFGNMFYDFRAKRLKVVDPRGGYDLNHKSVYGDWRYDAAKIAHSIFGHYDLIIANRFNLNKLNKYSYEYEIPKNCQSILVENDYIKVIGEYKKLISIEVKAMMGLLFLSMLTLHSENELRQDALLCNGLMIHRELT
jgi:hypothetical protein